MNNNTKIRLHLSKNLFESIAKEVLTEAKKANDGYTVAVKQPKMLKQSKSQAASPEVQKTDAEATMGEAAPNIPMPSSKPKMPPVPGQKPAGADNAKSTDLAKKAMDSDVIIPTLAKQGIIDDNEKKTLQTLLDKVTQAIANSIKEIETKVTEAIDFPDAHKYTYRLSDGNCIRINPETGERTKVHHTYCNHLTKEMKTKVAEEGKLKEFTGSETEMSAVYTMLATALGVGVPLAAAVIKDLRKAKTPEEKKKVLQSMASQIDKSKGVSEDKNTLKEYEHHYEMVNGQCRRYNDEGEYTVVSSHYCR